MSVLGWALLGLIAGFIATRVMNKQGAGCLPDIALGLTGALIGGFLFTQLGGAPVTGFNLYSMFVATIGAIIVLAIYHALIGKR